MKKGANSENALNKNALSEALNTIDKVISEHGRLRNKIIEIPTKMKEIIGAPGGCLSLLGLGGAIGAHDRLSFGDCLSFDDHLSFDERLSYYMHFSISSFFFLY